MFVASGVDEGVGGNCSSSGAGATGKGMFSMSGDDGGICDGVPYSGPEPTPGGIIGVGISGDDGDIGNDGAISGMGPWVNDCWLDTGTFPLIP